MEKNVVPFFVGAFLGLAVSPVANAGDCDSIVGELAEASPQQAAGLFVDLAACDAGLAKSQAATVIPSVLSGDRGNKAMVAAIEVGANAVAVDWIGGLQSDERASAIKALGSACNDSAAVQQFFGERAAEMGDEFWTQRWYRALAGCHVASVQEILWNELEKGLGEDRSRYFGALESFARSAGANAVPKLKEMATDMEEVEAQTYIVNAFADAAQVGSVDGVDKKAVEASVAAINELAPILGVKALEQARNTLRSLNDEQSADQLAAYRYIEGRQKDGKILWGVVLLETATCKNGKTQQRAHVADVTDPGQTWLDQLEEKVQASAEVVWEINLAEKCKGEGTVEILLPDAPFASESDRKKWSDQVIRDRRQDGAKWSLLDQDPIEL